MLASLQNLTNIDSSPEEPNEKRITKSGIEFDLNADRWSYKDGVSRVSLDFTTLTMLSPDLLLAAKRTLAWYAENRSSHHLNNLFTRLQHFSRFSSREGELIRVIDAPSLISYRSNLNENCQWYMSALAGFLKRWAKLGHQGVTPDAISLLEQLRLQGNKKGVAVMTMDPIKGPFTHLEVEAIQSALNQSYGEGLIEQSDYVLVWLYLLLGQRNSQYASLKVCDVRYIKSDDESVIYSIMMPSAKRRGVFARDRLVERRLVEQFGEVLVEYAGEIRSGFRGVLDDPDQAPLFPRRRTTDVTKPDSPGFEYHLMAEDIEGRLKAILDRLCVMSERTGKQIKISGHRFRRTLGTRAAEEGHSPLVIAALLDHTDTQNVGVYTASTPAIIDRIDRAIAMQMAPLAQAFAGVLIDRNDRDVDPTKRIVDLRIDRSGSAMGQCGKHGFCGFAAPIACYTCSNFEAWPDGPHEAVLSHLLERREQLMAKSDSRMASINDRTILAVASVVQRCAELNKDKVKAIDG